MAVGGAEGDGVGSLVGVAVGHPVHVAGQPEATKSPSSLYSWHHFAMRAPALFMVNHEQVRVTKPPLYGNWPKVKVGSSLHASAWGSARSASNRAFFEMTNIVLLLVDYRDSVSRSSDNGVFEDGGRLLDD